MVCTRTCFFDAHTGVCVFPRWLSVHDIHPELLLLHHLGPPKSTSPTAFLLPGKRVVAFDGGYVFWLAATAEGEVYTCQSQVSCDFVSDLNGFITIHRKVHRRVSNF